MYEHLFYLFICRWTCLLHFGACCTERKHKHVTPLLLILLDFVYLRLFRFVCSIPNFPFTQGIYYQKRLIYKAFSLKTVTELWNVRPQSHYNRRITQGQHVESSLLTADTLEKKTNITNETEISSVCLCPTLCTINSHGVEKYSQKFHVYCPRVKCLGQCWAYSKCSVNVLDILLHIYSKYCSILYCKYLSFIFLCNLLFLTPYYVFE